jgi:hypothetical protein
VFIIKVIIEPELNAYHKKVKPKIPRTVKALNTSSNLDFILDTITLKEMNTK